MTKQRAALVAAMAVVIGLSTAPPALATYAVSEIAFPNGATTFYSPFTGPASITLNYNDFVDSGTNDPSKTLQLRLRVQGGANVHTQNVTIDPSTQTSPRTVSFSWPALNVSAQTRYEVAVYDGSTLLRARAFTMKPWLVKIASISPNPFFPTLTNGHKDTTDITYQLAASVNPLDIRIYSGGTVIKHVHFDNRVVGTYHLIWNGRSDTNVLQPVGIYRVEVTATDPGQVVGTAQSNVSLERFYRVTRSKVKEGSADDHRDPVQVLRSGGTCAVTRLATPKDLRIRCVDARVRVYWRWTLPPNDGRIESVAFDLRTVTGYRCDATKGFAGTDSWLQAGALGQRRCRVDKARITYSFLQES